MSRSIWKYIFSENKKNIIFFDCNKTYNKIDLSLNILKTPIRYEKYSKTKIDTQRGLSRDFVFLEKETQKQSIPRSNKIYEITLWSRGSTIMPEDIGKRFKIHNGQKFISRKVVENMVNHRFGEFSLTKKKTIHKDNKKKQRQKK